MKSAGSVDPKLIFIADFPAHNIYTFSLEKNTQIGMGVGVLELCLLLTDWTTSCAYKCTIIYVQYTCTLSCLFFFIFLLPRHVLCGFEKLNNKDAPLDILNVSIKNNNNNKGPSQIYFIFLIQPVSLAQPIFLASIWCPQFVRIKLRTAENALRLQ